MRYVIVFLMFMVACTTPSPPESIVTIQTDVQQYNVSVELATTPSEQSQGLMFRDSLDADAGMYFVFDQEAQRTFWMKNTRIPLDIIFIAANGTIVDIHYALPCTTDPCATYPSAQPAQYVLEVNGNYTKERGITAGDQAYLMSRS